MNKLILFIVGSAVLFTVALEARSDEKHHGSTQSINVSSEALGIATAQIHPELGSSKLQVGAGIGTHNGDTAIAIGLHKRVNKVLVGGTFSTGNGETAIGAGINLKF